MTASPHTELFRSQLGGFEQVRQILPEELAAVDDFAGAHVEEIHGQAAVFKVIAEDIGIVALLGGGDALFLLELMDGGKLVAQARGGFKLLGLRGGHHARSERAFQFGVAAFKKQLRVAHCILVDLRRGESLNAGAEAAVNVVLQAGARMIAREIDLATGNEEAAMDEFDDAVGQIAGKVRAVVGSAVLAQAAGDKDFGKAVGQGELDVGVGLVVAKQDVEARLALLDEVVFKGQRLVLVGDEDVVEIDGLAHQGAGLGVGLRGFKQIGADPRAQVLGLAHVDDFALGVFVEVHAGLRGKGADFFVEVHGERVAQPVSRIAGSSRMGSSSAASRPNGRSRLQMELYVFLTRPCKRYTLRNPQSAWLKCQKEH